MAVTGDKNEIVTAPFLSDDICAGVSGETLSTTSASLSTSPLTIEAPVLLKSSSVACE
ncbi:unannotated protein [freshwater metagenome]|uniref:Unannotated protein n=1 Tax=freshwater metagenome TaxID=449393 RepID=A0A6J6ANT3_9ZZZZ